jgi:hypothetical protein
VFLAANSASLTFGHAIYDPVANTYTNLFRLGLAQNFGLGVGAQLLPTGNVVIPHWNAATVVEISFDGTVVAFQTATTSVDGITPILVPDGNVFFARRSTSTPHYIYSPASRTNSVVTNSQAVGFGGTALLPDGRVIVVPASGSSPEVFDYRAPSSTSVITPAASNNYDGAVSLPDGRVVMIPRTASSGMGIVSFVQPLVNAPPLDLSYHPCFNKL